MGEGLCWLNGRLVPLGEAHVGVEDRGLLYGDGIFETMRAYEGRIFRLSQHLERLHAAAQVLRLPGVPSPDVLATACHELLRAQHLREAYVRVTVTRGAGGSAFDLNGSQGPTVLVTARAFDGYPPQWAREGITAAIAATRRNPSSPLTRIKSLNYLDNLLARADAVATGAQEALLLDPLGRVLEASASNVFAVIDGVVTTAPVSAGVLPGITRACVLELCRDGGLSAQLRPFDLDQLLGADEAFLTSSLMEVMPLVAVNGRPVGTGCPGALTRRLQQAYREAVRRQTGAGAQR